MLIESSYRWNENLGRSVAAAYGVSVPAMAVTRPGAFPSAPDRRRPGGSESVIVTIKGSEPAAGDPHPDKGAGRPEGKHLIFRRALAAYERGRDLSSEEVLGSGGSRRVVDRAAVYRDRSYF